MFPSHNTEFVTVAQKLSGFALYFILVKLGYNDRGYNELKAITNKSAFRQIRPLII